MRARLRVMLPAIGLLAGLGGCAYPGTPVPVAGNTQLLAGEWEGTYSSEQTGRTGAITFSLKAGTDSAFGDVVMIPSRAEYPPTPAPELEGRPPSAMARVLRISFVWCSDGEVTGRLDPYEDPLTAERIYTTFEGRLERNNRFRGTFISLYPISCHRVSGTWSVTRKPDP